MTKAQAVQFFGSSAALARAIGVSRQSVHGWRDIPIGRQYQLEVVTNGKLRADRDDAQHAESAA
jgi:hypothetical protein